MMQSSACAPARRTSGDTNPLPLRPTSFTGMQFSSGHGIGQTLSRLRFARRATLTMLEGIGTAEASLRVIRADVENLDRQVVRPPPALQSVRALCWHHGQVFQTRRRRGHLLFTAAKG